MAWRRAQTLINENRPLLDAFANRLLANEVLERDDIERLVAEHREGTLTPHEPANGSAPVRIAASERLEERQ
jgi:hypothetical protein